MKCTVGPGLSNSVAASSSDLINIVKVGQREIFVLLCTLAAAAAAVEYDGSILLDDSSLLSRFVLFVVVI